MLPNPTCLKKARAFMPASVVPTLNILQPWKQGSGFAEKYLLPSLSSQEYKKQLRIPSTAICTNAAAVPFVHISAAVIGILKFLAVEVW